jgi:hypothetical protein
MLAMFGLSPTEMIILAAVLGAIVLTLTIVAGSQRRNK